MRRPPSAMRTPAGRTTSRSRRAGRDSCGSAASFIRSGIGAKRYISFSCQCSCMRMPRISGKADCRFSVSPALSSKQVGIADDGVRPAMRVGHRLHPGDLLDGLVLGPVALDIDRFLDAAAGDVGEIFLDRIVAPDRLVGTEDARHHRPLQPGQIGLAPDVVMGVDDRDHAAFLLSANLWPAWPRPMRSTASSRATMRSSAGRLEPSASASRNGRMPAMPRVAGR